MELWGAIKAYVLGAIGEELSWLFFLIYFVFTMVMFRYLLLRIYGYRIRKPEPPPPPEQDIVLEGKVFNHEVPQVDPVILAELLRKSRPMGCHYTIHPVLEGNNDTVNH